MPTKYKAIKSGLLFEVMKEGMIFTLNGDKYTTKFPTAVSLNHIENRVIEYDKKLVENSPSFFAKIESED